MANSLQTFRNEFNGVRPNRFLIEAAWPDGVVGTNSNRTYLYVKGADVPGSNIGIINVGWQGRIVKFSGERTYTDWVISVYDGSSPADSLRQAFEEWIEAMDKRLEHKINYNLTADWVVNYNDMGGTESVEPTQDASSFNYQIKLKNCFPVDISPITLSYDVSDSFAEFTVQKNQTLIS